MPKANVNGINLYYKVHGRGEPLVLIMGLRGGHGAWFFQVPAFKRHYTVITFDSRGTGKSDKPSEPCTIRTMADDTVGLMDHLGLDRAHVLGVSLGGMIAQEIALNYPERVAKLVLGSTTAGREEETNAPPELLVTLGLVEEGSSEFDISNLDFEELTDSMDPLAFNTRLFKWLISPLAKIYMKWVGGQSVVRHLEAALAHSALDRLHLIKAPTLVITGAQDRLVPPEASDRIASRVPNARLVKVEGGSHALVAEMRGRFNREVLDFLRSD